MASKQKLLQALNFTRSCYYNEPVDAETNDQGNEAYSCLKEAIEEIDNLRDFAEFVFKNSVIWTDKAGYDLEFQWIAFNSFIPKNKRNLIRKLVKKYGKQSS